MQDLATPQDVVAFWREAGPERWFTKDESFDALCSARFLATYEAAARGDLNDWELVPEGALAVVLLLDQFPRNMFRGTRRAYQTDRAALDAADRAIEKGFDAEVEPALRGFFYLPFEHAESLVEQERSVALHERAGDDNGIKWARHHHDLVARFGRFPHRNAILGRESTEDERAYLAGDGAFTG